MANKKIYKNRLSLPIFDNKGMGNGNGIAYVPNIIRGGSAIPIGNNMFFMKGKSHNQGGIDIGKDLEVERNEVVQNGKFGTRVFSSVPFLRGVSPAQRVLQGENPDTVFAAQENWKRINKINDDGSRKAALGINLFKPNSFKVQELPIDNFLANSINKEIETPEVPTYVLKDDEKPVGKKVNPSIIGGGRLYNGYAVDNHEKENINGIGGGRVYNDTSTPASYALPGKNKYSEEEIYNQRRMGLDSALDELHISSKDREKYYDLLIPQSVLEPGWTIPEDNNYFGHLKVVDGKRVKIRYANPKDAWLKHIKNLNTKWPNWITANNQKEYFDIINNESLGLHTLQDWKDYVAKNPTKNAYIYAPAWENNIKQYVDSLSNISNKFNKYKAFGGDKTYVAPKWAQDSYKKYGKVVIGGEPLGIGLGVGRVGTFTGLMRNNLLRSAFRNFKKYGSRASTIIKDSYYDLTDALAKPFIRSEKAYKTFKKVRGIGYDTLFGDRRLDGTVKTGKGDFEFFSNLSRLPITFNETNNIINGEKQFGGMKLNIFKLGGLSRSKDYGSKDKPYPSVNKNDFAGGGRSYPIPTRADAVDALRLAGLHHRSDVRAKVYAKYPDLRKKAKLGKYSKITGSPTNEKVVEPVRTNYVERNNSSNNLGVGIGTILGGGAALSGLGYAGNKLYDKVLEYNEPTAKKAREYSKFLEKRAANERAIKKAIADRQETLNNTYGKRLSKELNKSIKKGFSITPSQPAYTEKSLYTLPNAKKYVPSISEFSPAIKRGVQKFSNNTLNLAKRLGTPIKNVGKVLGKTLPALNPFLEAVNLFFPDKEQKQINENLYYMEHPEEKYKIYKLGGRKKAPYGDYVTRRDDSENIVDYIRKRRWKLPFEEDEQTAIDRAWSKALQYINENPNPGDLAVKQYEEHPLLVRDENHPNKVNFYHQENKPMFLTDPMVARWYNYGWSHNASKEVPNYANILANANPSKPVVDNTSRGRNTNSRVSSAAQKNNTPTVSSAAQRILDNAELAPYQNFSHPTLAEVAGRYPISERVGSSASITPISSSTGNGINPADVEAVRSGNFKAIDNDRYVPIHTTTEDWVGLGANLLGSIGSYLGTRAMLNRYPMPSKPVPAIAQKLKTRFNINSALDQIREQAGTLGRMVDNNTASSRVAQARKQGISNNATASTNQQYNQKENIETQLINQDIMNRQRVGLYNNQIYNNWLSNRDAVRQYVANAKIGNFNNVLSGANQSIQDLLGRVESRDALGRNLIFMQAAYPNVNWRNIFQNNPKLANSFGFRFLNN